jgi:hypothetical protein
MSDFVLPKHLRFARSLALVSSAAVGITAGASLVMGGGCTCSGTPCGGQVYVPPNHDAADAVSNVPDASSSDASMADALPADAGAGGGPLPAPPLPLTWLS